MKSHEWPYSPLLPLVLFSLSAPAAEAPADKKTFERGRYLIVAGGCNDCHTPGYPESNGKTPRRRNGSPVLPWASRDRGARPTR